MTPTVLLFTTTVGYQARAFDHAAEQAGVRLRVVSDRCDQLADPWGNQAIAARFGHDHAHVAGVLSSIGHDTVDGVLAVGDRPAWLAAAVAHARGLPLSLIHI